MQDIYKLVYNRASPQSTSSTVHMTLLYARLLFAAPSAPDQRWRKNLLHHRHSPSPLSELESTAEEKASSSKTPTPQAFASRRKFAHSRRPRRPRRPQ